MNAGWKRIPAYALHEAGVTRDGDLVRIPYRLPDGGLYANRVVADSGKRWWQPGDGRPVIPFGLDRLEHPAYRKYRVLAICEGESDSLAVWAALAHLGVDVLGVPGSGTWKPEWANYITGCGGDYCATYVVGDGDHAGRRMNSAVAADIPGVCVVTLPEGQDARSLIEREGGDALLGLFAEVDEIKTTFDQMEALLAA